MNYDKKSIGEIIEEFKRWPDDEFFPFFRHETLHYVSLIKQSTALIEDFLVEEPSDQETINDLLLNIRRCSEGLANLIYAAADYDKLKANGGTE